MKEMTIKISGIAESVKLKFDYAFMRQIGDAWGCDGPVGVVTKFMEAAGSLMDAIAKLGDVQEDSVQSFELPFSTIDMFADLIRISAKVGSGVELESAVCAEFVFDNQKIMADVIKLFFESMPKPKHEEVGKVMPVAAN